MPISCAMYDKLEVAAIRQTPVVFLMTNNEQITAKIQTFGVENHQEYLITQEDEKLFLEDIAHFESVTTT